MHWCLPRTCETPQLRRPRSDRRSQNPAAAGTLLEREKDPFIKRETLELVRAYYKIRESRVRKRIFEAVKALGAVGDAGKLSVGNASD